MNIDDLRRVWRWHAIWSSQKGLSEPDFERQYGSEEQCRAEVVALRWPDGFVCPGCAGRKHSLVKSRLLFQCSTCRKQTSLIAGKIVASTKLPLTIWFRAIYRLTQSKQGMSSIELGCRLGVTQTTAWKIKHKLERDAKKQLSGRIEIGDAYIGSKRGRGAAGETPYAAAVETTPDGKPIRLKLCRVTAFSSRSIGAFSRKCVQAGSAVVSDGLRCFACIAECGSAHQAIKTGPGPRSAKKPCVQMGQYTSRQYQICHHSRCPDRCRQVPSQALLGAA